jgi:glycine cleavage system H protein
VEPQPDRRYARTHEWALPQDDLVRVGISDYAQEQLGDIVFLELPQPGTRVRPGDPLGTVESVKAVSELWAPIGGEVIEANGDLADEPELVNRDPYGRGWMVVLRPDDPADLTALMDATDYAQHCREEAEE